MEPFWMRLIWTPSSTPGKLGYLALLVGFILYQGIKSVPQQRSDQHLQATIDSLTAEKITKIDLYTAQVQDGKDTYRMLHRITRRAGIGDFVSHIGDLSKWIPNHPLDNTEYRVIVHLSSGERIAMKLETPVGGGSIYHLYACSSTKGRLTLKSRDLISWATQFGPGEDTDGALRVGSPDRRRLNIHKWTEYPSRTSAVPTKYSMLQASSAARLPSPSTR